MTATNQVVGPVAAARSQRAWLQAVQAHPDFLLIRSDGQRNLVAVTRVIMWRAWRPEVNPGVWLSRPTNERIMQLTGLKQTACKRWRAWLRERGFLGTVTEGSTPGTRGSHHDGDNGTGNGGQGDGAENLAAEYVLLVPLDPEQPRPPIAAPSGTGDAPQDRAAGSGPLPGVRPLTQSCSGEESRPPSVVLSKERTTTIRPIAGAHTRDPGNSPPSKDIGKATSKIVSAGVTVLTWSLSATPGTRAQMLLAAEALRASAAVLRQLSARHLRSLLREFFTAGWSPADMLWALDHRPDGSGWKFTSTPTFVPGWVRFRLSCWRDEAGAPIASRAQRAEQARAARRAEQQRWRAECLRLEQASGECSPWRSDQVSEPEDFIAPVLSAAAAAAPSAAYRAERARMERERQERELAMLKAIGGR